MSHAAHIDDFVPCSGCGDCLTCNPHKRCAMTRTTPDPRFTPFKMAWAKFIADCIRDESSNPNKSEDGGRLLLETIRWRLQGPDGKRLCDLVAQNPQEILEELTANIEERTK